MNIHVHEHLFRYRRIIIFVSKEFPIHSDLLQPLVDKVYKITNSATNSDWLRRHAIAENLLIGRDVRHVFIKILNTVINTIFKIDE